MIGGPVARGEDDDPLEPVLEFVSRGGAHYAVIRDVDRLDPFLIHVVGDDDVWLFAGSNGPFTAGRRDPDTALFPYVTADKLLRNPDTSGATTVLRVKRGSAAAAGLAAVWEPWRRAPGSGSFTRNLYKRTDSTEIVWEETDLELGLRFSASLTTCAEFGLVRHSVLENLGSERVAIEYLDGWRSLVPPGIGVALWDRYSYLATAYVREELSPDVPLAVYALNAAITDRPEANESLRSACAWTVGDRPDRILLTDRQIAAFRSGRPVEPEDAVRGEVGAFLLVGEATLRPGESAGWYTVADTGLDQAALVDLRDRLRDPDAVECDLQAAVEADRARLRRRVAAADGLQASGDEVATVHHFTNVLFNAMRGGTFDDSYRFPSADLRRYLRTHNREVAARHADWLDGLPAQIDVGRARRESAERDDSQLERLVACYLPLTFSRRHGDPSRPWNRFAIRLRDERGEPLLAYEGNWRDIFQNWETIAHSYPGWLDSMIAVFLNASTADGYNPYRVTKDGVDWEIPNPDDPWASIGYWGDHQLVYLERLIDAHRRFFPGRLRDGLAAERSAYVAVPYRIAGLDALLRDPHESISFERDLHDAALERVARLGADGRLLAGPDGQPLLAALGEKLLLPLLVKLTNFVPGGGIWLNTQRPEWNDANNALAGWGLSIVTVAHARRYLETLDDLLAGAPAFRVSEPVARLFGEIVEAFREMPAAVDDRTRLEILCRLGRAGERHRDAVYRGEIEPAVTIEPEAIRELARAVLPALEATLRSARREDGLYDGYDVLEVDLAAGIASVRRLYPMLEGQVAALDSGMLSPHEAVEVVRALRASDLYRADQHSYVLYPDRELPPLIERNTLPSPPPLEDPALFTRDARGGWHFQAELHTSSDLEHRLTAAGVTDAQRAAALALWEAVFHHGEFTGRSRTFFMFEGLGSIYWHMVAKLLLAVQRAFETASAAGEESVAAELAAAYDEIQGGLGFRKTAEAYGAFPTDPYSHTPRHRGAQQPGMTGLVKEEILARWSELGVRPSAGTLVFAPRLLHRSEFTAGPSAFDYVDLSGTARHLELPAGALAFTYCGTPIVYRLGKAPAIAAEFADGSREEIAADSLPERLTRALLARDGSIDHLTVEVPAAQLRP